MHGAMHPSSHTNMMSTSPSASPLTPTLPSQLHARLLFPGVSGPAGMSLAQARPKCNSLLHLMGSWLFEASLIGTDVGSGMCFLRDGPSRARPGSFVMEARRGSQPSPSGSGSSSLSTLTLAQGFPDIDLPSELAPHNYEGGRAEAVGTLCRIFSAKRTGEEILPAYLARFYLSVQHGLKGGDSSWLVLASILLNSSDLFRVDLEGVMVLVPYFIEALEMVLPDKELKFKTTPSPPVIELRRSAIHLLLSILPLPLHFRQLPIKDLMSGSDASLTFYSLRAQLVNLLIGALQCETDSVNTQMLLGGLLTSVQDAAINEDMEQIPIQHDGGIDTTSLLMTSATVYDNFSSYTASDITAISSDDSDLIDQSPTDSAHALFLRAVYLVCHRLISSWTTDTNVSLAALELLTGFAKIKIPDQYSLECKRAVKWVCDYIVHQCSRPPPFHSRDLHSAIVAAFHCVATWLLEHPELLQDKECLNTILEVVELGISGSKSQPKPTDVPKLKGEKTCKPASMRVHDAAESLLTSILEQAGYFPAPSGPALLGSLLDEEALLQYCDGWTGSTTHKFRYFTVTDSSTILALLDQPLGNDQDPQPTVVALIRGPFGRHAWALQLRHLPRHLSSGASRLFPQNPGRPVPVSDVRRKPHLTQSYFPESANQFPICKVDKSIPPLESVISGNHAIAEHIQLLRLIDQQTVQESNVQKIVEEKAQQAAYPNPDTECKPPPICQEFETARLFLSHFGFLSLEAVSESLESLGPQLLTLDSSNPSFFTELQAVDNISSRTCDTAFIFYVKSGQKSREDILNNMTSSDNMHPHFVEFLLSLGCCVDVSQHPGWTGHVSSSWCMKEGTTQPKVGIEIGTSSGVHGSMFNGQRHVLYWADGTSEIAFVVPSTRQSGPDSGISSEDVCPTSDPPTLETGLTVSSNVNAKPRTLALELDKNVGKDALSNKESPCSSGSGTGSFDSRGSSILGGSTYNSRKLPSRQSVAPIWYDAKAIIVWLERYEDHLSFPLGELAIETSTGLETSAFTPRSLTQDKDIFVIFIHPLQNGLFRVKLQGQTAKMSLAIPLVDGMIISRRALGVLIRQMVLNMCRRRRLEHDSQYPPHIRRKAKIQEIVHRYGHHMPEPQFYASLFGS